MNWDSSLGFASVEGMSEEMDISAERSSVKSQTHQRCIRGLTNVNGLQNGLRTIAGSQTMESDMYQSSSPYVSRVVQAGRV